MQKGYNIFSSRKISLRVKSSRFNPKIKVMNDFDGLIIRNNYSIKIPDLCFTNFLSADGTLTQKAFLNELKIKTKQGSNILDKMFEIRELKDYKTQDIDRLLKIVNSYDNTHVNKITDLIKSRYNKDKACQLYMLINRKENYIEVVLIDLYHMGFFADYHNGKSSKPIDFNPERQYNKRKNYAYDINKILRQG